MPSYSLRQLTLAFLLLFLSATILTGAGIYSVTLSTIRQLVDKRIDQVSHAIAPDDELLDRRRLIDSIRDLNRQRDTGDLGIMLFDGQGRQIAGNVRMSRALAPGFTNIGAADNIEGLTKGRARVRDIPGDLRLIVVAETEPFDHYDNSRVRIYLAGFGSIIAIVVGGLVLFSRMVGRRITDMRRTVDTIFDGDMDQRVPVTGHGSEFDLQAEAFNRMLDRIQVLMDEIRNVSNDIAHELRTPLSRLRGRLALLQKHAESDAAREGIGGALEDADDLLAMFTAILRISEIESGERSRGFAAVDLGALADEIVGVMEPVADESGHVLVTESSLPVTVRGDPKLLTQLVMNLVENALRHTPAGSHTAVTVRRQGEKALISVTDNGPGIAEEQRSVALRRFARLEHRRAAGHGLGLPLVAAIARLHGGELRLEDAAPGLRVVATLPLE